MKKLALPLLLLVMIGAGVVWAVSGPSAGGVDPIDPFDPGPEHGQPVGPLTGRPRTEDPRPEADPEDSRRETVTTGQGVIVTGRCVDAKIGTPLAGCEVTIDAQPRRFRGPRFDNRDPDPVVNAVATFTDANGKFRAKIQVPPKHHVVITTRMEGQADMEGYLARIQPTMRTGDIEIPGGARLDARVVDEAGTSQPGVQIRFFRRISGARPKFAPKNWIVAMSDDTGELRIQERLVWGTWSLGTSGNTRLIKPVGQFVIDAGMRVQETTLVVRMPDPKALITGKIVGPDDAPVPRATIHAVGDGKWPIGYGFSDKDGKFEVRCRTKPGKPVYLSVPRARGFESAKTAETYAWGSTGITLRLRRAGDLTVQVVEADTDQPVEDFGVVWLRSDGDVSSRRGSNRQRSARHKDGIATLEGVPEGKIRIVVTPKGRSFAPNEPVEFLKSGGNAKVRIELPRRVKIPVHVTLPNGQPVAGTRLQLVQSRDGKPVTLDTYPLQPDRLVQLSRQTNYAVLLDTAKTGDQGHAVMSWSITSRPLSIRVLGPGHVPAVKLQVFANKETRTVEITVDAGATLSGVVKPLTVLQELSGKRRGQRPSIILEYTGKNGPRGRNRRKSITVDEEGRFRFEGLQPGTWDVTFHVMRYGWGMGANTGNKKFPPITVQNGDDRRVEFDISDMRPAVLHGQVFLNGAPAAQRRVHLTRVKLGTNNQFIHAGASILTTDDNGGFRAEGVHAGRYRVSLDAEQRFDFAGRRVHRIACPDTVDVVAGRETSHIFRIHAGTLRVRVEDQDGKPVAKRYLVVQGKTSGFRTGGQTDDKGVLQIEQVAAGTYTVSVYKATPQGGRLNPQIRNQLVSLGTVVVTAGAAGAATDLVMPKD